MRGTLEKIKPIVPDKAPAVPLGAKEWGRTPDGRLIYELTRKRSRGVPDIDPVTGEQKMRRNLQGEPLYPLGKQEVYDEHLLFTIEYKGSGNMGPEPWIEPSEEEVAAEERKKQIAAMREGLAAAFVDAGLTPEQAVAALVGQQEPAGAPTVGTSTGESESTVAERAEPEPDEPTTEPDKAAPDTAPEEEYPVMYAPGRWKLSDGSKMQGTKVKALEAEQQVQALRAQQQEEARQAAEATPSF